MKSASEDAWDKTTRRERGPLDANGGDEGREPHKGVAFPLRQPWSSKGRAQAKAERAPGGMGLNPGGPAEVSNPS